MPPSTVTLNRFLTSSNQVVLLKKRFLKPSTGFSFSRRKEYAFGDQFQPTCA